MINQTKYKVGQRVLIDKIFVVNGATSQMKKLNAAREAIITEVQLTPSMGPSYNIEWADKSLPKPRIRYWEDDINGLASKENT